MAETGEWNEAREVTRAGRPNAFRSMRHQQFRWLYASNMCFFFAMQGQMVVRSYLAFKLTDSALALGLVNLAIAVPMLIVSPFGGVIADRVEKRRLIMTGQVLLLTNEAVVFALLLGGWLEFWHLFAAVFALGAVFPVMMPARQAIVVNIVGREGLQNAMALQMGGMNAARVVGPALAGFLIWIISPKGAYVVALIMYAAGLLTMLRVTKSPPPPRRANVSVFGDMAEGFRFVRDQKTLRVLMIVGLIPPMFAMPFQSLLVVFTEDVWRVETWGLGVLQAAAGLGGVAGAFLVAFYGETERKLRFMFMGLFGFAGSLLLFSFSPWFLLALPLVFITDVFASMFQTNNSAVTQLLVPDYVRGRVMSLGMMTFGLTPLGAVPVAAAAEAWGAPVAVGGSALFAAVLAALAFALSKSLRGLDATAKAALESPPGMHPGHPRAEGEGGPAPGAGEVRADALAGG